MTEVSLPTNNDSVEYTYDAMGRRLTKVFTYHNGANTDVTTYKYHYIGSQITEIEIDAIRNPGEGQTVLRNEEVKIHLGANSQPISYEWVKHVGENTTSATYYYHYDIHGNVLKVTDSSENVKITYTYDVLGKILTETNPDSILNFFTFRGASQTIWEPETGMYYSGGYYRPDTGTSLQGTGAPVLTNPTTSSMIEAMAEVNNANIQHAMHAVEAITTAGAAGGGTPGNFAPPTGPSDGLVHSGKQKSPPQPDIKPPKLVAWDATNMFSPPPDYGPDVCAIDDDPLWTPNGKGRDIRGGAPGREEEPVNDGTKPFEPVDPGYNIEEEDTGEPRIADNWMEVVNQFEVDDSPCELYDAGSGGSSEPPGGGENKTMDPIDDLIESRIIEGYSGIGAAGGPVAESGEGLKLTEYQYERLRILSNQPSLEPLKNSKLSNDDLIAVSNGVYDAVSKYANKDSKKESKYNWLKDWKGTCMMKDYINSVMTAVSNVIKQLLKDANLDFSDFTSQQWRELSATIAGHAIEYDTVNGPFAHNDGKFKWKVIERLKKQLKVPFKGAKKKNP